MDDNEQEPKEIKGRFKPGQSGNLNGRPKGVKTLTDKIQDEDREYYGTDSRKFLERALLRARTWEEGLKIAKELRALQHASLQSIQTKIDNTHTLTLRWSTEEELSSNTVTIEGQLADDKEIENKGDNEPLGSNKEG